MMKTFKRILALVMVFCTVAAWMIPGVSVFAETVVEEYVYNFGDLVSKYGLTDGGTANTNQLLNGGYLMSGGKEVNNAYGTTSNWAFAAGDRGGLTYALPTAFGIKPVATGNNNKYGFAIKLQSPGAGEYEVALRFIRRSYAEVADNMEVYILPMPDYDFFDYVGANANVNTYKLRHAMNGTELPGGAKLDDSTRVLRTNVQANVSGPNLVTEKWTYDFEANKEYMVVFVGVDETAIKDGYFEVYDMKLSREVVEEEPTTEATTEATTVPAETEPVETEPAAERLYNFGNLTTEYGCTSGNYLMDSYYLLQDGIGFQELYPNTSNWAVASGHRNGGKVTVRSTWLELGSKKTGGAKFGFAIKMQSPGAGTYDVTVNFIRRSTDQIVDNLEIFILPMPEADFFGTDSYALANAMNGTTELPGGAKLDDSTRVIKTTVEDDSVSTSPNAGTANGRYTFEANKEYMVVFAVSDNNYTGSETYTLCELASLKYSRVVAAAKIGDMEYDSLDAALIDANSGDTIDLGKDVTVDSLNLDEGVTLNLNGKTLTALAVSGAVIDSTDGEGKIAGTENAPVITVAENNIVLKDTTGEAPCYRIFSYTFKNAQIAVSGTDEAVTGVNKTITFYDYEKSLGTTENKFRNVSADLAAKFAEGKLDWRVEMGSQGYQFRMPGDIEGNYGTGSNGFSSGTESISYESAGWFAIRIKSPGEGKMSVSLKTDSSNADIFDVYIVKASEIEETLGENYATYSEALINDLCQANGTTDAFKAYLAAVEAAFADEDVVISVNEAGVDASFTGSYEFEAGQEYVVICKIASGFKLRLESLSFYREGREESTVKTFWSDLDFTNEAAYAVVATGASGLTTGFNAKWNGADKEMAIGFNASMVADWAAEQGADMSKNLGFYVRVSGFENLTEDGVLAMTPYVESDFGGGKTAGSIEYNTAE